MTESNQSNFVYTNYKIFYRIALESYDSMKKYLDSRRKPRANGKPGWIVTADSEQKSFKAALVTLVFCGIYLESLFHLCFFRQENTKGFKSYDKKKYEEKLQFLGCKDQSILSWCEDYRKVRRKIVHEKAHTDRDIKVAQDEAETAINMIKKIADSFELKLE